MTQTSYGNVPGNNDVIDEDFYVDIKYFAGVVRIFEENSCVY